MFNYSRNSEDKLFTAHKILNFLFHVIISGRDNTIVTGHRYEEEQNEKFNKGFSKIKWPNGKHNSIPSDAVDSAPYLEGKATWNRQQALYYAGFVMGVAWLLGIEIRCGADWDCDGSVTDQGFHDETHFELVNPGQKITMMGILKRITRILTNAEHKSDVHLKEV